MDLSTVADELYGLVPREFTAARDARAAEARREGDRALATEIKALRRPSVGAWLANLLVRRRPTEVDRLLSLGGELRHAQDRLAGDQLRELSQQRHRVVSAVVQEARRLGAEAGQPVSEAAARELQETLEAAMADPDAGPALRAGRLTAALRYSGLGPGAAAPIRPPTPGRAAAGRAAPGESGPPAPGPDPAEVERAEDALAAAEGRAADSAHAHLEAERQAEEAVRSVTEASRELELLRSRADAARERAAQLLHKAEEAASATEAARMALRQLREGPGPAGP